MRCVKIMHNKIPSVLVIGGAGFVGSHVCKALAESGMLPIVYDNLSNGTADAVKWGPLEKGDIRNEPFLLGVVEKYRPIAAMHFAAFIEAGESVVDPIRYYENNVAGTLSILRVLVQSGIKKIIFSSTAAVYGSPCATPIPETHAICPINPYGRSKAMVENILNDLSASGKIFYGALRYFNAAGADAESGLKENHKPETHLIPLVLDAAFGRKREIYIFGDDYPTKDGTCIRDYVHVSDLADAHVMALHRLLTSEESFAVNLGSGRGFSVREIVQTVETITNRKIITHTAPRRAGDPAILVADVTKAKRYFSWNPTRSTLSTIITSAVESLWPGKIEQTLK